MGMYYPPRRPDEIYHWGIEKGSESKNHKYFNRILTGVKNGQNIYRYFYDKAEWDAYKNNQKQQAQPKQANVVPEIKNMHSRKASILEKVLFGAVGSAIKQAYENAIAPEDDMEKWDKELSKPVEKEPEKPEITHPDGSVENPKGEKAYKYVARIPMGDGTFRYFYTQEEYAAFLKDNPDREESQLTDTFDLKKTVMTPEEDMAEINEKYKNGKEYQYNCWSCGISYEMRRRGFDVEATRAEMTYYKEYGISTYYGETSDQILSHWKDSEKSDFRQVTNMELKDASKVFKENTKREGEGARGIIYVCWDGGGGHVMNWEVTGGETVIRDCQTNKVYKGSEIDSLLWMTDLNNPKKQQQSYYQSTTDAPIAWFRTDTLSINDLDLMRRSTNRN